MLCERWRSRFYSQIQFHLNSFCVFVCVFSSYWVTQPYKSHTGKCGMMVIPKFYFTAKMFYFKDQRRSWHKNLGGFLKINYIKDSILKKAKLVWNRMIPVSWFLSSILTFEDFGSICLFNPPKLKLETFLEASEGFGLDIL